MGEAPTHPELLDWLAVEFMNRGWSIKQINKLMMTSAAYQMAATGDDGPGAEADPENRYLSRFRPQRLDAEIVRDSMLVAGGNLNPAVGGEPIFPFIPKDILTGQFRGKWENTPEGPAAWRRGVYVYRRRSLPYPMFDTFDHPDMNVVAGARNVSTVPTQALTLLNNPFVLGAGRTPRRARAPRGERSGGAGRAGVSHRAGQAARRGRARGRAPADRRAVAGVVHARAAQSRRVHVHEVSRVASMLSILLGPARVPLPVGRRRERPGAGVPARA